MYTHMIYLNILFRKHISIALHKERSLSTCIFTSNLFAVLVDSFMEKRKTHLLNIAAGSTTDGRHCALAHHSVFWSLGTHGTGKQSGFTAPKFNIALENGPGPKR